MSYERCVGPIGKGLAMLAVTMMLLCCVVPVLGAGPGTMDVDDDSPTSRAHPGYYILSTVGQGDEFYQAAQALKDWRGGEIIEFDPTDLDALLPVIREKEVRYAAIVIRPTELNINFTREFLMMSTNVDDDIFSDFSYGFISGATGQDALNFVNNIKQAEQENIQDAALTVGGFSASSVNWLVTSESSYMKFLDTSSFFNLYLEVNDTGAGLDFYDQNKDMLEGRKVLDIGHNGDPHMLWLFDGGNFDPDPPSWTYDPDKVEDPAYARMGLTNQDIGSLDLYPAVAFTGHCHAGVLKTALVESDIEATFGDTNGQARFYEMSDDFSYAVSVLRSNVTGYFAPNGANNANDANEDMYNAFRYDEPLGDTHKRSIDAIVMAFMGNRPNLRIVEEGDSIFQSDVLESGDFDPDTFPIGSIMLGGKANRIYYGDPLYDPYKYDRSDDLNLSSFELTEMDPTTLDIELSFEKPQTYFPVWDKFHDGGTRIYDSVVLPEGFEDILSFEITSNSGPYHRVIHAIEKLDGRTILHIEVDVPNGSHEAFSYDISFRIKVPKMFGVDILSEEMNGTVAPGETMTFEFPVKNIGNALDDISLEASSDGNEWKIDGKFNGAGMLYDEVRNATVKVTPPADAQAGMALGRVVMVRSGNDVTKIDKIDLTTTVSATYGIDILGEDRLGTVGPGENITYELDIKNLGNDLDRIMVGSSEPGETWGMGINVRFPTMLPFGNTTASVWVSAPPDALAGDSDTIVVTAISEGDEEASDSISITTTVGQMFGLDILSEDLSGETAPATEIEYELKVRNTGNDLDRLDLDVSQGPDGWTVDKDFNGIAMLPGEERTATIKVTPPKGTPAGEEAFLVATATSGNDPVLTDTINITTTVLQLPTLDILAPADIHVLPGESAVHTFTVINLGNGNDTFSLVVTSENGWIDTIRGDTSTGELEPGDDAEVMVVIKVPVSALADDTDVLELVAVSDLDPTVSMNVSVRTTVLPTYGLDVSADKVHQSIEAGEVTEFEVTIGNTGNDDALVKLEVVGQYKDWALLTESSMGLGPKGSKNVTVKIVPTIDTAGNYTFVLKATSGNLSRTMDLVVTIEEEVDIPNNTSVDGPGLNWLLILLLVVIIVSIVVTYIVYNKRRGGGEPETLHMDEPETELETGPWTEETQYGHHYRDNGTWNNYPQPPNGGA